MTPEYIDFSHNFVFVTFRENDLNRDMEKLSLGFERVLRSEFAVLPERSMKENSPFLHKTDGNVSTYLVYNQRDLSFAVRILKQYEEVLSIEYLDRLVTFGDYVSKAEKSLFKSQITDQPSGDQKPHLSKRIYSQY